MGRIRDLVHLCCMNRYINRELIFVLLVNLLLTIGCTQQNDSIDQPITVPEVEHKIPDTQVLNLENRTLWQKPNIVLNYFGDLTGKTVADIGAGSGFFSIRLAAKGAKVLALDIDPSALQTIDEVINLPNYPVGYRKNIEMRLVKANDPQLEDDLVDAVLISNTITFISDRLDYLKKIYDYLQPGGQILIVDYKMTRLPFDISVRERVPLYIVENELFDAGFANIIHDQCALDFQYIISGRKPKVDQ